MLVLWSHYFCGVKVHLLLDTFIYKFINSVGSKIHECCGNLNPEFMDSVDRNNQINFKEFHKINV